MDRAKPYDIPKREVWEAYKRVKANQGAVGVDGQSIADFEADLSFQQPLQALELAVVRQLLSASGAAGSTYSGDGKTRPLGIPTVADRIAQTVVKRFLEPLVERSDLRTRSAVHSESFISVLRPGPSRMCRALPTISSKRALEDRVDRAPRRRPCSPSQRVRRSRFPQPVPQRFEVPRHGRETSAPPCSVAPGCAALNARHDASPDARSQRSRDFWLPFTPNRARAQKATAPHLARQGYALFS